MRSLLLLCFALSGVSGLIYEIVWTRQLGFIFGSTAVAVSICLAIYLGGLALGSYFSGPIADRLARPVRAYALMELAIGACGLLSLPLLYAAEWLYAIFEPLAFLPLALALLPPTILMGATLPVLIRATPSRLALVTVTGRLYSANTLGGVGGAALAGFVLLPHWGMFGTAAAAAALNLALALILWKAFGKSESPVIRKPASNAPLQAPAASSPVIWIVMGVSGFCALLDQVLWTRSLAPVVGSSTWSFALMLSPFLLGLALGIAAAARLARAESVLRRVGPVAMLAWAQSLIATAVFIGMSTLHLLPAWFSALYENLDGYPGWFLASQALICGSISLVPAFLIGMVFPLALALVADRSGPATRVGRLYSINTAGAILGACLAGLVVIPWLGLRGGFLLSTSLNMAMAAILLFERAGHWLKRTLVPAIPVVAAGVILYAAPAWNPSQMATAVYNLVPVIFESGQDYLPVLVRQQQVVFYREAAAGTVAVTTRGRRGILTVDGIAEASEANATQVLLPHYAMATGPAPRRALVIGYGSGNTAGSLALYPFEQIDVAEIEPATVEAGRFFEDVNHRPDRDARVRIHRADGRSWLAGSPRDAYDVIVSHPSMPWGPVSGKLFTREFFHLARTRLRPGAVFAQSVPIYNLDFRSVQSLLRTFADAFPEVLVVTSGRNSGELILLGSDRPVKLDWNALGQLFATPERTSDLTRSRLRDQGSVASRVLFGTAEIAAFTASAPLNTDNNGLIEFASLVNLYRDTREANTNRLFESAVDARNYIIGAPAGTQTQILLELTNAAVVVRDYRRGLAYAQELLGLGDSYTSNLAAGDVLYGLRRTDEAITQWRRSLQLDPDGIGALIRLIRHYKIMWPRDRPADYPAWVAALAAKTPGAEVAIPSGYLDPLADPEIPQ